MANDDTSILRRAREVLSTLGVRGSDDAHAERSVLESVAFEVGESLVRWRDSAAVRRFLGVPPGRDQVVALEQPARLSARVGPIAQMGASGVRFYVDGEPVGECGLQDDLAPGVEFWPRRVGLFRVELQPLAASGADLAPVGTVGAYHLQVVDGAVFAVDADVALAVEYRPTLRRLEAAGAAVFYFDLSPDDRAEVIRAALASSGLPHGALLTHPDLGDDLEAGATDFTRVLGLTAVRRLHAASVPVVGAITLRGPDGLDAPVPIYRPDEVDLAAAQRDAEAFAARRAGLDALTWRLNCATDTRLLAGNDVSVEFDNRKARERVLALIGGAQHSIHLQTYMFTESRVGEALVVALVQKARAGVRVRVIVDALYSGERVLGRRNPLLESLTQEPNAEVVVSSPIDLGRSLDSVALKQRDHRKLLIVDGKVGIVSGRNIGDTYYRGFDETPIHEHTAHEHIPWLDAHIETRGPIVAEIQSTFTRSWLAYDGVDAPELHIVSHELVGDALARLVVHNGLVDANAMLQYEAMLDAAEHHVYIVNDFPIVPSLANAMHRALARGVQLRLLTGNAVPRRADGTFFPGPVYRELFDHMVKQRLEPLIRAGAQVFEYVAPSHPDIVPHGGIVRPYVHAKVMTCDGRAASVGSANLDATASYWEHEANLVVQHEPFVEHVEQCIQSMIDAGHPIDLDSDYWKRDRSKRAVVAKLWPAAVYS